MNHFAATLLFVGFTTLSTALYAAEVAKEEVPAKTASEVTLPTPLEVKTKAVEARQKIKFGRIAYSVTTNRNDKETTAEFQTEFDYRQGFKLRYDVTRPKQQASVSGVPVDILGGFSIQRTVRIDDRYINYSPDVHVSEGKESRIVVDMGELKRQPSMKYYTTNPLILGMTSQSYGVSYETPIDAFLLPPQPAPETITKVKLANVDCYLIERVPNDRIRTQKWIAPQLGYSVLQSVVTAVDKNGELIDTSTSTVAHHVDADVWFPKTIVWQRSANGKITADEKIVVRKTDFTTEPKSTVFTLEGLDIFPGTSVIEHPAPPGPTRMWDGEKLVPYKRKST